MSAPPPPAAPGSLPYDYLFKVLIIGDASVGKVRERLLLVKCTRAGMCPFFHFFSTILFNDLNVIYHLTSRLVAGFTFFYRNLPTYVASVPLTKNPGIQYKITPWTQIILVLHVASLYG